MPPTAPSRPQLQVPKVEFPLESPSRIVSTVKIGSPAVHDPETGEQQVTAFGRDFVAIWDTGAVHTVAVPLVINTANLTRRGFRRSAGIDGVEKRRPVYPASVFMPLNQGVTFHFTEVTMLERDDQLHKEGKVHMLIGMDIISRGDTTIAWRSDGRLWFTFSPPRAQQSGAPKKQPAANHGRERHPTKKSKRRRGKR